MLRSWVENYLGKYKLEKYINFEQITLNFNCKNFESQQVMGNLIRKLRNVAERRAGRTKWNRSVGLLGHLIRSVTSRARCWGHRARSRSRCATSSATRSRIRYRRRCSTLSGRAYGKRYPLVTGIVIRQVEFIELNEIERFINVELRAYELCHLAIWVVMVVRVLGQKSPSPEFYGLI